LGPIISRLFTCSNAEKNNLKKQRVLCKGSIKFLYDAIVKVSQKCNNLLN
jgi:hypothetical protein